MDTLNNLVEKFKRKRLKLTPQRLGIFKILKGNSMHPSAENIYNEIKKISSIIILTYGLRYTGYKLTNINKRN